MNSRQKEIPILEEIETKEIEIPEKCKTEKIENPISEKLEVEETEIPEVVGEVETPVEVEVEQTEVSGDAETEIPKIDGEQTEIPEVGESVIVNSDDGSIEMLGKICAQMDTLIESQDAVTEFTTPSGPIAVIHNVTLGDLLISTLLVLILLFNVLNQLIRRF